MRIRSPLTAALVTGLLLAGCAGTDSDPSDERAAETDAGTQDATGGAPTDEGTTDDDGSGELADDHGGAGDTPMSDDVGEPADASEATRTISVDAFDMAFDPAAVSVEPGEVVTFEVTNTGEAVHEFLLGDRAMQQEHAEEMAEMDGGMAHDEPYSIRLDPGETKQLTWRFAERGTVEYACHEPGHYEAGMSGAITIG